jgi:HPt (histidine-containing phosphotransfer) domain-containing protein
MKYIDVEVFGGYMMNNSSLMAEMTDMMLNSDDSFHIKLQKGYIAIQNNDYELIEGPFHNMKTYCRYLGANKIADISQKLELKAKADIAKAKGEEPTKEPLDPRSYMEIYEELKPEIEKLIPEIVELKNQLEKELQDEQ